MAVVLHRHHGELVRRRRAGRAPAAPLGLAGCGRHRGRCAHRVVLASLFLLEEKKVTVQAGWKCASPSRASWRRARSPEALPRRRVPVSLFLRARLRHAALLLHDRRAEVLAGLYRHPRRDRLGRLDRRRPGASLASAADELEGAAESQHRARNAVGGFVPVARGRGHGGDRELRQRRCPDDRHHRLAHARRGLLPQALRGLRIRRAHVDHESRRPVLQHRRRLALRACFDSRLGPLIIVSAATTAFAAVLVPLLRLDANEPIPA